MFRDGKKIGGSDAKNKIDNKSFGFYLIELLVVLAIVGILSMLALPIYSNHLIRARRLEAEMNIIKIANGLEKYFLLQNTYANITLSQLNIPEVIADHSY